MTKKLHISPSLALPLDTATDTIGVLAIKGSGKTYTALVLFEEMVKAGIPIVGIDPVGVFFGLRSSADGKRKGLPVIILGGSHGDAPLEPRAGATIADWVIAERTPCVLDLSGFETKAQHLTFAREFLERLYQKNREALHVMIDEADDLCPQKPMGEETRVLRAVEVLVRRGRARGIGCTLITQRAAVLNKNVLTQCSTLVLGRTISPQDRKAIQAWVDAYGADEQKAAVERDLSTLPQNEKYIWSPGRGLFARVPIRERETFDSSATPKMGGGGRTEPRAIAEVDLEGLKLRIAATIEKAKAEDPRELRRRIADLEKQLATKPAAPAPAKIERVEVPILTDADRKLIEKLQSKIDDEARSMRDVGERFSQLRSKIGELASRVLDARVNAALASTSSTAISSPRTSPKRLPEAVQPRPAETLKQKSARVKDGVATALGTGERAILTAAAQYREGVTPEQLTVLLGYKRSSRNTYLQRLTSADLAARADGRIVATAKGVAALGPDFEALPTGAALRDHWIGRLPEGERRIFEIVVADYPKSVDCEQLSEMTGYLRSSRNTYLQRLSSRQLITKPTRGEVRASDALFDGGRR